jgi:hypothetical protein
MSKRYGRFYNSSLRERLIMHNDKLFKTQRSKILSSLNAEAADSSEVLENFYREK